LPWFPKNELWATTFLPSFHHTHPHLGIPSICNSFNYIQHWYDKLYIYQLSHHL
jgi:hypothetical protein